MNRDHRIEGIARDLCDRCKGKITVQMANNPGATAASMTVFVLRVCCRRCKQTILRGVARMGGRT